MTLDPATHREVHAEIASVEEAHAALMAAFAPSPNWPAIRACLLALSSRAEHAAQRIPTDG